MALCTDLWPHTWGDLSSGTLEVLTEPNVNQLVWAEVPDPSGDPTPCKDQVADTKRFDGGEGIDLSGNNVVFTTKGDNRVWSYDPTANMLTVIYDAAIHINGVLTGVDNVETSDAGVVYVCEDGGDMQVVLVRENGSTFPVVQIVDNSGSELCGAALTCQPGAFTLRGCGSIPFYNAASQSSGGIALIHWVSNSTPSV